MASIEFTSTMVKTLKGAPISVLLLLAMAKTPLSAQYLERESGYSDKAVNSALLYLADHGLITRNGRYAWQIANGVKALPLMIEIESPEETPADLEPAIPDAGDASDVGAQTSQEEVSSIDDAGSRRNSESEKFRLPSSSNSSLTNSNSIDRSTTTSTGAESEKFRVTEVRQECQRAGIWSKRAAAIAAMPHVTGRLIRYWTQWAAKNGKELPLAIWRIEHDKPIPEDWIDGGARIIEETTEQEPIEPLPENAVHGWEAALILLEKQFRRVEYETWIKSLTLSWYGDSGYVLRTANKCGTDWLNAHALTAIEAALQSRVVITWG